MESDEIQRLVDVAGFIFRGSVHQREAGAPPAIAVGADDTLSVRVEEVLHSTPVLRGLAGQHAFLITRHAGLLRHDRHSILFTDVVSLGQTLLLREIGHAESTEEVLRHLAHAIHENEERPLRERIVTADLIVTGEVVESHVLDSAPKPKGEHDPIWWLARVAVKAVHKGRKPRGEIEVLFAASIDRAWVRSPKLYTGTSGILLLHLVKEGDLPGVVAPPAYQATHPLDLQPVHRLADIERGLGGDREGR
jgi:hypothetical protein